jgi:hypothetical protein
MLCSNLTDEMVDEVTVTTMSYRNELIPISATFLHETPASILVMPEGEHDDGESGVWLPKSQIHWDEGDYERGDSIELEVPRWLADDKELG